jgi:hypothetical protein
VSFLLNKDANLILAVAKKTCFFSIKTKYLKKSINDKALKSSMKENGLTNGQTAKVITKPSPDGKKLYLKQLEKISS